MNNCIICNFYSPNIKLINKNPVCESCYNQQQIVLKSYKNKKILHPDFSEIIPNKLFISNSDFAQEKSNLLSHKITHILLCGEELGILFPNDFVYFKINLHDWEEDSIIPYINETNNFIKNSNIVLVHCNAGVSRSPSIVIAYLIKEKKMNFDDAFNLVKNKRKIINPNETFIKELKCLK
jgi:protein-tyrosine phosphatase